MRRWANPQNVDLICTKGDLRRPLIWSTWVCVRNKFPAVEIDSNHRLSWTVRNLASSSIVVTILWNDGYDEHVIIIPAMVTIVMLLNDIPHVWNRLVANL